MREKQQERIDRIHARQKKNQQTHFGASLVTSPLVGSRGGVVDAGAPWATGERECECECECKYEFEWD